MVHLREIFFFNFMVLYLVSGAELGARGVKTAQDPFIQRHSEPAACFHLDWRLRGKHSRVRGACQTETTGMLPFWRLQLGELGKRMQWRVALLHLHREWFWLNGLKLLEQPEWASLGNERLDQVPSRSCSPLLGIHYRTSDLAEAVGRPTPGLRVSGPGSWNHFCRGLAARSVKVNWLFSSAMSARTK